MTGLEIKEAAENYVDESIDDTEALTAINKALTIIGDRAHKYASLKITVDQPGQWISLPQDLTTVREVVNSVGAVYSAYRVRGNQIAFEETGSFTVYYRRLPNRMSGISETPDVHPAYHEALVTYVVAWWKLKDDDESPDGLRREQEFRELIARADATLSRGQGPRQWQVYRYA